MEILLNGNPTTIDANLNVELLIASLLKSTRGVAVAVDRAVIPRSEWTNTALWAGAVVEIVTAVAGG